MPILSDAKNNPPLIIDPGDFDRMELELWLMGVLHKVMTKYENVLLR